MPKIVYTESYEKKSKKFLKKHSELLKQYEKVLNLLEINPEHPSLRLHKFGNKLVGLYSVSINMKYRISLEFIIQEDQVIPINIGSHDDIYRSKD